MEKLYTDVGDQLKRDVALMKAYPIALMRKHKTPEGLLYCDYD